MTIRKIENIINVLLILATIFLHNWYSYMEILVMGNSFFAILLKYILLYFSSAFMGEIISIIYLYNKKRKNLFNAFANISGVKVLLYFIVMPIVGLTYIGIMYSFYIQIDKPYTSAIVVIVFGIINGFQIGVEKYYEENKLMDKVLVKIKKNKRKIFRNEKPFDHSFNNMLSTFFVIFVIFYPINYIIETHIDNIIFTIVSSAMLFVFCYKIINIIYDKVFIYCELEYENSIFTTILYFLYSIGTFIGFIYYDISIIELVNMNLELNDLTLYSNIILIIMTGYLPIRLIPIIFSMNYKLYEKILNIIFIVIYTVRKIM
ncbi:hypothetical protein FACS1894110_23280 [Spirochaetia bacterium]|nr:hypothetical protein FACS1894110_23280 [Spirochaetia bacterium]